MSFFSRLLGCTATGAGGNGGYSITVPVMDGPLKPNDVLDRAPLIVRVGQGDNLTSFGDGYLLSSGANVMKMDSDGKVSLHSEHKAEVSALAVSPSGDVAVGLAGQDVTILFADGATRRIETAGKARLNCVTALAYLADGSLAITNGSADFAPDDWAKDLVHHGASGLIACLPTDSDIAAVVSKGLRFPAGICSKHGDPDKLVISECWRHRILEICRKTGKITKVLADHLPSYPARITPISDGGYVLTNYSVRSQLIEFVLREKRYLRRMIQEMPSEYWIAPSLSSGHSFMEPLQAGGVIRLGIHKPWAPSRSYGLVIGLNDDFLPVWSAHSRANGQRHGVTSVAAFGHGFAFLARGNGDIAALGRDGKIAMTTSSADAEETA